MAALWAIPFWLTGLSPAAAWKPSTHIYLAEQALSDAIDDGKVTLLEVDRGAGRIVGVLGHFDVDPQILQALRSSPAQYRAGVLGPDAYPDILTGQQIIHPPVARAVDGATFGSDAWLTHLWRVGIANPQASDPERAFSVGYLAHASGDAFAHTYVNHFAGGPFTVTPPDNAAKHMLLEGYIGKRTPSGAEALPFSIESIDGFLYDQLVDAKPGSALQTHLLVGGADALSIPRYFSALRNRLQANITAYDSQMAQRAWLGRQSYRLLHGARIAYLRAWTADIDRGLRAWPAVSHEVAEALIYYPDHARPDRARAALGAFVERHLFSMTGAPDLLIKIGYIPDRIGDALLPVAVREALSRLARAPLEMLIKVATGLSADQWIAYAQQPETYFDPVINSASGAGRRIDLATFNHEQLKIADDGYQDPAQRWSLETFPPAFNSVQLNKMLLLGERGRAQLDTVLRARGVVLGPSPRNLMLGWIHSLDGSNQWRGDPLAAFAAGDAPASLTLFMPQLGESAS